MTLKINPRNVILYAKWDLCYVYDSYFYFSNNNSQQKIAGNEITEKRVIVDVSEASTFKNKTITVEDISEIFFIGKPNVLYRNITIFFSAIKSEFSVIFVHFNNFNINGSVCQLDPRISLKMTLDYIGICSINSPTGISAISGFTSLKLTGSGNITIKGGAGVAVTTAGTNGANGAAAISVNGGLTISVSGNAVIIGGNGSNGEMVIMEHLQELTVRREVTAEMTALR